MTEKEHQELILANIASAEARGDMAYADLLRALFGPLLATNLD